MSRAIPLLPPPIWTFIACSRVNFIDTVQSQASLNKAFFFDLPGLYKEVPWIIPLRIFLIFLSSHLVVSLTDFSLVDSKCFTRLRRAFPLLVYCLLRHPFIMPRPKVEVCSYMQKTPQQMFKQAYLTLNLEGDDDGLYSPARRKTSVSCPRWWTC